MRSIIMAIGRLLLSAMFVKGGSDAFREPGGRVDKVSQAGIPDPKLAVRVNGGLMTVAGSMLGLGITPRLASIALIASIIPTTVVGHAFWRAEGASRKTQLTQFLKNLGLLGGLLLVLSEPAD